LLIRSRIKIALAKWTIINEKEYIEAYKQYCIDCQAVRFKYYSYIKTKYPESFQGILDHGLKVLEKLEPEDRQKFRELKKLIYTKGKGALEVTVDDLKLLKGES